MLSIGEFSRLTHLSVRTLRRYHEAELLEPDPAPIEVELRAEPARTVAAVDALVSSRDVETWYAGAVAELQAAVGDDAAGPLGGTYDNSLFEDSRGHALVYLPTASPPRTGRVHPVTLPAAELAVTTHVGDHDGVDVTYGKLGTWVVENAMAVAGPVREVYRVGPHDSSDPDAWRTEIGWPVFRIS